jgi:hypothetical protein
MRTCPVIWSLDDVLPYPQTVLTTVDGTLSISSLLRQLFLLVTVKEAVADTPSRREGHGFSCRLQEKPSTGLEGFEPPTHGTGNRLADTGVPWLA